MRDLVVLVADKNAQFALQGAIDRHHALGIRETKAEFRVHPGRDGGVRKSGPEVLAPEVKRFRHSLLLLDWEGCGASNGNPLELEEELNERLAATWGDHGRAIVIEPEVDIWMWGSDNSLEQSLGWEHSLPLREFLREKHFELRNDGKPLTPKEALECALWERNLPRSAALYARIAGNISLKRCQDAAFLRLREVLRLWFAPNPSTDPP